MENEGGRRGYQGQVQRTKQTMCLEARQWLRATLSVVKQGCAFFLNQ